MPRTTVSRGAAILVLGKRPNTAGVKWDMMLIRNPKRVTPLSQDAGVAAESIHSRIEDRSSFGLGWMWTVMVDSKYAAHVVRVSLRLGPTKWALGPCLSRNLYGARPRPVERDGFQFLQRTIYHATKVS